MSNEINVIYFGEETKLQKYDIVNIDELIIGLYGHIAAFALEYQLTCNFQYYILMMSAFIDIYEHHITAKQIRSIVVSFYISAKNTLLPNTPKPILIRTALKFLKYHILIDKLSLHDIYDLVTTQTDENYSRLAKAHEWVIES